MQLPRLAIKNHQFTLTLFILLTLFGTWSYFSMPRTENPTIYIPGGSITVIYPGATPADLEQLVAIPIEEAVNELDDIKKINTTLIDGLANIAVEFNYQTDAKEKYDELVSKVTSLENSLPDEIFDIRTMRWTSSDVNILQYALISEDISYKELRVYAENLKNQIEQSFGIRKVELLACPEEELSINIDLEQMSQMNLGINQVIQAIQSNNANIPGGNIKIGGKTYAIKTSGSYENIEEIRNTIVHSHSGNIIRLRDIATVDIRYEDIKYHARVNNTKAIFVTAQQKEDINIFKIMQELHPVIKSFEETLPDTIHTLNVFNQAQIVDERINGFLMNLLQGIILVGIIMMLALGVRQAVIVSFSIPLSILIGLGFVDLGGFGLQQISIAGLVVSLGLLVDNSIVMIENISRFRSTGASPSEAAIKGSQQIGWAVVSATITTLLAFVPLIMMPDKAGDFIKSLPVTIITTLSVSLLLSLALTPLISTWMLKKQPREKKNIFSIFLEKLINGIYTKSLDFALKKTRLTLGLALASLALAGVLIFLVGVSFFPKAEQPQFLVRIYLPEGSSLQKTNEITNRVEQRLNDIPNLKFSATNVGHGNPRIYYNTFTKSYNKNFAEIFVQLNSYNPKSFNTLIDNLRNDFDNISGAKVSVKEFEQGIPTTAPVEIYVLGPDVETLENISVDIENKLLNIEGTLNIENQLSKSKTDLYVQINKDKAGMYGVPVHEIDKTIRACINGLTIDKYRNPRGDEYNIVIRLPEDTSNPMQNFDRIYVQSVTGKMIPLSQFSSVSFQESKGIITRFNLSRNASITADIDDDHTLDEILQSMRSFLQEYALPPGYSIQFMGEYETRNETFGGMSKAILIAVIAILAVLVLQFRSFKQPLIIFTAIPLSALGSALALYITGHTFSFTAFVGFISLTGIVVNNAIILVDYTNQLRNNGNSLASSIREAAKTRFTPIILTTLTTIGGLLPLTLQGGTLWAPLGWVIIGGLLFSTFLTLIIVPVLYQVVEK